MYRTLKNNRKQKRKKFLIIKIAFTHFDLIIYAIYNGKLPSKNFYFSYLTGKQERLEAENLLFSKFYFHEN